MRLIVVCLVLILTMLAGGCGDNTVYDSDEETTTAADNNERTIGNPAVYERISSSRNCTALQEEFDVAMDNAEARESGDPLRDISLSYANAANNRMREIGCYG